VAIADRRHVLLDAARADGAIDLESPHPSILGERLDEVVIARADEAGGGALVGQRRVGEVAEH
jgi:hypothetical protein